MWESTTPTVPPPASRPSSSTPSDDGKDTGVEPAGGSGGFAPPPQAGRNTTSRDATSPRTDRRVAGRMARCSVPLAALLTALTAGLLQKLLVLLLPHLLTALLDERRQQASLLLSRPEQVPEVDALGAVPLLEANGPQ